MPDLDYELRQLAEAERHLDLATANIADMRANLARERELGLDTETAEQALRVAEESFAVFVEHRRLIEQTIEDIRAGRLPNHRMPGRK